MDRDLLECTIDPSELGLFAELCQFLFDNRDVVVSGGPARITEAGPKIGPAPARVNARTELQEHKIKTPSTTTRLTDGNSRSTLLLDPNCAERSRSIANRLRELEQTVTTFRRLRR